MPTFDTGNANWNETLGGIAGVLFPDQSKEAAAYYHGALARKAQIEGNKAISEQNAMTYLPNILGGQQPNYTYRPAGLTGAAPVLNPAQNLPGVTPGMPGPALSSAFTPPSPQAIAQSAANTPAVVEPFTRGTAPAYVSPAPGSGAPPAPTGTTSIGTTPTNEVGSGPVHPATLNTTGGGRPQAPPASSNGSPAQQIINPAQYALAMSQAGIPDAVIRNNIATYFGQLHAQGSITDRQYYDNLASVNITTPLTTTLSEAGATTRQGMSDKAALERTNVTAAAHRYASDIALRTPGTYAVGGALRTMTPTQSLAEPGAIKAPAGPTEAQGYAAGQVLTMPPGPGRQAALSDVYSLGTSAQTYGPYIPPGGGAPTTMAAGTAATTPGVQPEPASETQQIGRIAARASDPNATPEQRATAAKQLGDLQVALAKGKPPDQNQLFQQQILNYQQNNRAYAATRQDANQMPVYVTPDADVAIRNRAAQLMSDERTGFRDHPDQAYNQARQELVANGTIESPKDVADKRKKLGSWFASWNTSPDVTTIVPPGAPADTPASQHIIVGLKNPVSGTMTTPQPGATPAPGATTQPPPTPGGTPPVPTGPTPAPAGGGRGATITTPTGQTFALGASLGPLKQPAPPDFTVVTVNGQQAIAINGQAYSIAGR